MKIAVVLLSWKRPRGTFRNLKNLASQTVGGFRIIISNANPEISETIHEYKDRFSSLDIEVRNDSNDYFCFRRFFIAKELAESGIDVIFFIDDDVIIPKTYIENAISQYEAKTYSSAYAWVFSNNGSDYYRKRSRVYDNKSNIKYCGAGVSMIDASIFLDPGIFDVPREAYGIDDLWLSYYSDHVAGYKLKYLDIPGVRVGGDDGVALLKEIRKQGYTKKDFLIDLVKSGWKVS